MAGSAAMATVFFSYFLAEGISGEDFERRILAEVAPVALAEESVLDWRLHRTIDWPGSSDAGADYVCLVCVTDLPAWSEGAPESVMQTHGALSDLVHRITMTVTSRVAG
jgi:hypothetical protein